MRTSVSLAAVAVLTLLVVVAGDSPVLGLLILAMCFVLFLVVALGPTKVGVIFALLAMFTAPQNSIRPLPGADLLTFSDVFMVGAGLLLLPVLLEQSSAAPPAMAAGRAGPA